MTGKVLIFIGLGYLCIGFFLPLSVPGDQSPFGLLRWAVSYGQWSQVCLLAGFVFPLAALPMLIVHGRLRHERTRAVLGWVISGLALGTMVATGGGLRWESVEAWNGGAQDVSLLVVSSVLLSAALVTAYLCLTKVRELKLAVCVLGYGVSITGLCALIAIFGVFGLTEGALLAACVMVTVGAAVEVVRQVRVLRAQEPAEPEAPHVGGET